MVWRNPMRRRELLSECLSGIVVGAASACSRRRVSALEKLRVGAAARIDSSSLYLAQELGFFREAGIEMEILQNRSTLLSMALLADGKLDVHFGIASTAFLNAILKGLPLKIVAGREIAVGACGNAGAVYGMRRTFPHGLADLTQLRGKRVATATAIGIGQFSLDAQLARAGLTPHDVKSVRLEFRQMVAALLGGGIDAFVGANDFDRDLTSLGEEIVHSGGLAEVYPKFQYNYILFGKSMWEGGLDRGARFLSAYLRGAREFAHGKTPRFLEELIGTERLDRNRALTSCRDSFVVDGAIDLESLRLFAGWAARNKYISRPADVAELVDDRFLRKAHAS
jgi:ABC-type nitrate/sulfonate/bicarbonate transport system substrate-binding protein